MGGNGERRKRRWAILRVFDFRLDRHLGGAAWYRIGTAFSLGNTFTAGNSSLVFFLFHLKELIPRFVLSDLRGRIGILYTETSIVLFCVWLMLVRWGISPALAPAVAAVTAIAG